MCTIDKYYSCLIAARFRLRQAIIMCLHTSFKGVLSKGLVYTGVFFRVLGLKSKGLELLFKGRRVNNVTRANSIIRKLVQQSVDANSEICRLLSSGTEHPVEHYNGRTLILKLPVLIDSKIVERGAIIVKFTETFDPIYRLLNVSLLSKYFRIILEPSSVGYSLPEILSWTTLAPEKVIVLSPYRDDFEFLSNVTTNLIPLTLGPADWVDTSIFYKLPDVEKIYDVIYLASFNPIKRIDRYIRAIVRIKRKRPNYRAALVCAGHGDAKREVLATMECAKNRMSVDLLDGMDQPSLNVMFNKSKVNILVSLREGANKGLAEGFFSGTPAILIKESAAGNHVHINDQTGRVVPDSNLESALTWFADHDKEFSPHEWAMSHISPTVSAHLLSENLKELEISEGQQWTRDLFTKVNRPELDYLDSENSWLLSKRAELLSEFSNGADEKSIITFLEQLQETTTG